METWPSCLVSFFSLFNLNLFRIGKIANYRSVRSFDQLLMKFVRKSFFFKLLNVIEFHIYLGDSWRFSRMLCTLPEWWCWRIFLSDLSLTRFIINLPTSFCFFVVDILSHQLIFRRQLSSAFFFTTFSVTSTGLPETVKKEKKKPRRNLLKILHFLWFILLVGSVFAGTFCCQEADNNKRGQKISSFWLVVLCISFLIWNYIYRSYL